MRLERAAELVEPGAEGRLLVFAAVVMGHGPAVALPRDAGSKRDHALRNFDAESIRGEREGHN